jgi:hypothetical protein
LPAFYTGPFIVAEYGRAVLWGTDEQTDTAGALGIGEASGSGYPELYRALEPAGTGLFLD